MTLNLSKSLTCLLLLGTFAFSALAQQRTCDVRIGVFSYTNNTPIEGAKLVFTDSTGSKAGSNSFIAGKFDRLASGKYKVEINKDGYGARSKEFSLDCAFANDGVFPVSVYLGDVKALPAPQVEGEKGILKGFALYIPTPKYPVAMRGLEKVSRTVTVTVTIDEDGNVISGKASDDESLFGEAAVNAAMGAKFQPTRLSGEPVKVMGSINFNFVP